MTTRCRKLTDKTVKALDRAYDCLSDMSEFIPDAQCDQYLRWLRELNEYAEYLRKATWPDKEQ